MKSITMLLQETAILQLEEENEQQLNATINTTKQDRLAFLEDLKGENDNENFGKIEEKGRKKPPKDNDIFFTHKQITNFFKY